jgi:hypothetical protein
MLNSLQGATIEHFGTTGNPRAEARRMAGKLFDRVHSAAVRQQWLAGLTGRAVTLPALPGRPSAAEHSRGVVTVPLNKIVGSEGRNGDFDAEFRPLKANLRERWMNVAAARRTGLALPPVELVRYEDDFYVRDGHHRISVARAMGQREIEALVVNS